MLTEMRQLIPDQFKKNCLVVIAGNPPYYLKRISADERLRVKQATNLTTSSWIKAGYHSIAVGDRFDDADYCDSWHLVAPGGRKMAKLVARQVLSINRELGYCLN